MNKKIKREPEKNLVVEDCEFLQTTAEDLLIKHSCEQIEIIFARTKGQAINILEGTQNRTTVLVDWDLWKWFEESFDILRQIHSVQKKC